MKRSKKILSILLVLLLIFSSYLYWDYERILVNEIELLLDGLPTEMDGFTLLHVSDLHSREFGPMQAHLLKVLQDKSYNIVVYTGDMIDRDQKNPQPFRDLVAGIEKANEGVKQYFVTGNHEYWSGINVNKLIDELGIVNLNNKRQLLYQEERNVWLMGISDPHMGKPDFNSVLQGIGENDIKILLAHSPVMNKAVDLNFNLVLSGHTHGGQVRIPFVGAIVAPNQGLFPYYDKGLYKEGNTQLFISSGLGFSSIPIRLFNPAEVVLITLRKK
ncbi:MAG: metallophosphoesterase [Bacillota bacterium]